MFSYFENECIPFIHKNSASLLAISTYLSSISRPPFTDKPKILFGFLTDSFFPDMGWMQFYPCGRNQKIRDCGGTCGIQRQEVADRPQIKNMNDDCLTHNIISKLIYFTAMTLCIIILFDSNLKKNLKIVFLASFPLWQKKPFKA